MPVIAIKNYTWRQTPEQLILRIPLAGHPTKVDLFLVENYLKASFPPFLLELFLWGNVIEEESECTVTEDEALLSLKKENNLEWPQLELHNIDKNAKREYRNRALERSHRVAEDRAKAKSEQRQLLQKEAVKAQINLDTATLNKIEAMRNTHRREVMQDLEEWKASSELPIFQNVEGVLQKNQKAYKPPLKWFKDADGTVQSRESTSDEILKSTSAKILITEAGKTEQRVEQSDKAKETCADSNKNKDKDEHKDSDRDNGQDKGRDEDSDRDKDKSENKDMDKNKDNGKSKGGSENKNANENKNKDKRLPCTENVELRESSGKDEESSSSSDSQSNCEGNAYSKSEGKCLIKEIDGKTLPKFYKKKLKERPGQELVKHIPNGKPIKKTGIFDDPGKSVPLPRQGGVISVKFSERAFPTPARESSRLEEEEWLQKQAEARRKTGFVVEDLRPEERDPQWLKDKGDEFFKVKNYLGAVSAYTHGIKISDKMASLYVNRSAAQYALGNYVRCMEDCSKALELMEPKCEANRESRARCHARRGAALCKLSAPQHGIPELEAALKLLPDNDSIKSDLLAAKRYFDLRD